MAPKRGKKKKDDDWEDEAEAIAREADLEIKPIGAATGILKVMANLFSPRRERGGATSQGSTTPDISAEGEPSASLIERSTVGNEQQQAPLPAACSGSVRAIGITALAAQQPLPSSGGASPMATNAEVVVQGAPVQRVAAPMVTGVPSGTRLRDAAGRSTHAGQTELRELLDLGTAPDDANGAGDTALHRAAERDNPAAISLLLERRADVNVTNMQGRTPLCEAAEKGAHRSICVLLEARAAVDVTAAGVTTPLMLASKFHHEACVRQLLESGADCTIVNATGKTASDMAVREQVCAVFAAHGIQHLPRGPTPAVTATPPPPLPATAPPPPPPPVRDTPAAAAGLPEGRFGYNNQDGDLVESALVNESRGHALTTPGPTKPRSFWVGAERWTVSTSTGVQLAPAGYASLDFEWRMIRDMGDEDMSYGRGTPCELKCEACSAGGKQAAPSERPLKIYKQTEFQRNGNYKTNTEIVCVLCGRYTLIRTWEEG